MQEFLSNAQAWIAVIGGLVGLIAAIPGVVVAIKSTISKIKAQSKQQNWALIMSIADAAMKEAEASGKAGAEKKDMVIAAVKAGCQAAGIEVGEFIDDLMAYIDDTIAFVNGLKAASKTKKTVKK